MGLPRFLMAEDKEKYMKWDTLSGYLVLAKEDEEREYKGRMNVREEK